MKGEGEVLQVLRPDGSAWKDREPSIKESDLRRMYETMVAVRIFNERGMALQRQGRISFFIGSEGQEAVHVGAGATLQPEDWYFPHYRDPGVALLRGATLESMIHQLFGNARDPILGRQMPNHFSYRSLNFFSISSPLSTQIPQAVGAAFAMKYRKERKVAMVSFGDGSTSEGDFHVGMNFAGVWKAPVVFLCNNNQYAISVPLRLQTASESIAIKAIAYGFEGVRVDGNDVLAVYVACREAVEKAREGRGPTLIEAVTFRMGPHSSSDDPRRYVPPELLEEWKAKDPLRRFQLYLERQGLWSPREEEELRLKIQGEIQRAVEVAESTPPPALETLFDDVYAEVPPHLRKQRDYLLRFHGR